MISAIRLTRSISNDLKKITDLYRSSFNTHSRKIHAMAPKSLNFITGNKNKLAEVQAILAPTGVKLSNQSIDLPELQGTIEEISLAKCEQAAKVVCAYH